LPGGSNPEAIRRGIDYLDSVCEQMKRPSRPEIALSTSLRLQDHDAPPSSRRTLSINEAIKLLQEYASVGVDHVSLVFPLPNLRVYLGQMELFATEVMPALQT
jgi:hypothetical protein